MSGSGGKGSVLLTTRQDRGITIHTVVLVNRKGPAGGSLYDLA